MLQIHVSIIWYQFQYSNCAKYR